MVNMKGEKPPEPKSTPEEKQVSEVKDVQPDKQKDTEAKAKKKAEPSEGSNELDEKYKNLESELGRLRQELGDERKKKEELESYKLWYDQNVVPQQQQQPKPEDLSTIDAQWYDKPTETFRKQIADYESYRQRQDAIQSAPMALSMAKMMFPDRFEGVDEQMIQQVMYGSVKQGMHPAVLKNPEMWAGAAWIAKGAQSGYRMPEPAPKPMTPVPSEAPGGKKPSEGYEEIPSLKGDELTEMMLKAIMREAEAQGKPITREEAIKEVMATRELEGR